MKILSNLRKKRTIKHGSDFTKSSSHESYYSRHHCNKQQPITSGNGDRRKCEGLAALFNDQSTDRPEAHLFCSSLVEFAVDEENFERDDEHN